MACSHLRKLYQLCQEQKLFFSASDLVRIVCKECDAEEVCPTSLTTEGHLMDSSAEGNAEQTVPTPESTNEMSR